MYAWLNLGSLILGMIAWILPVVNLVMLKADSSKWPVLSAASISACAVSLWMQLVYTGHLVKIEDWSALMDTSRAVVSASSLLLAITLILNAVAWTVFYRRK